uniref:Uncharacterized protein n=1 Tax=Cacopsylla melanoneura TaxID=428564 RepID=A0A8D8S1B5_9HEMI
MVFFFLRKNTRSRKENSVSKRHCFAKNTFAILFELKISTYTYMWVPNIKLVNLLKSPEANIIIVICKICIYSKPDLNKWRRIIFSIIIIVWVSFYNQIIPNDEKDFKTIIEFTHLKAALLNVLRNKIMNMR